MIPRYTRPEMGRIWTEENKLQKWLDVELAALQALAQYGYIPKKIPSLVRKKARFNIKRVHQIEKKVNHDVIAFLTNVAEYVGPAGRYVHYGMTSSDILDTGLALQVQEASDLLMDEFKKLLQALKRQARKHRKTLMVGRSHGIHAEPVTFGLKMALFYAEFERNLKRLRVATENMRYGKISGAVGTFAHIKPEVEVKVCKLLKLNPAPISTQIIQRDRHAEYLTTLAVIASSLDKLATEIRGLQKTDTREVEESFSKQQKGSSAMPHKRNPIACERIAGLARVLRGNAVAAMENVALWHERDITHSSVERIIFPESTILLHYMLTLTSQMIDHLTVFPKQMMKNLENGRGMVFSQGLLLQLIGKGVAREKAYRMVQACAKKVWENPSCHLRDAVNTDKSILKYLSRQEINKVFDYQYHIRNVSRIFKRVGID